MRSPANRLALFTLLAAIVAGPAGAEVVPPPAGLLNTNGTIDIGGDESVSGMRDSAILQSEIEP